MKHGTIHTDAAATRCLKKTPQEQLAECREQLQKMRDLEKLLAVKRIDKRYDGLIKGVEHE